MTALQTITGNSLQIFNAYFIRSDLVKVFPCAWRGQTNPANIEGVAPISFNQEARLNTEFNFTHIVGNPGSQNTYIIKNNEEVGANPNNLCFCIAGYYFELSDISINDLKDGDKNFLQYVTIKIKCSTLSEAQDYAENTKVLDTWLSGAYTLDYFNGEEDKDRSDITKYVFTGLAFTADKPIKPEASPDEYITLQLLSLVKQEEGTKAILCPDSYLPEIKAGSAEGAIILGSNTDNEASGKNSVAIGKSSKAKEENQVVIGQYNEDNSKGLFIVGAGTDKAKHNAFVVDADDVTVHGLKLKDVFASSESKDKSHYDSIVKRSIKARHLVDTDDNWINEGSNSLPVYFKEGIAKALTEVGTNKQPVYLSNNGFQCVDQIKLSNNSKTLSLDLVPALTHILTNSTVFSGNKYFTDVVTFNAATTKFTNSIEIGTSDIKFNPSSGIELKSGKNLGISDSTNLNSIKFETTGIDINAKQILINNGDLKIASKLNFNNDTDYIETNTDKKLVISSANGLNIIGEKITISPDTTFDKNVEFNNTTDFIKKATFSSDVEFTESVTFNKGFTVQDTMIDFSNNTVTFNASIVSFTGKDKTITFEGIVKVPDFEITN